VSHLGERAITGLVVSPDRNQVEIDFYSLGFRTGQRLRYQHRIEGIDTAWSAPSAERTIHYPRLAAGHYEFLVRAVTSDGLASAVPARVGFTILPPIWQRWWFQSAAILFVAAIAVAGHRSRVRRLLDTERVRTRLASDLHDDIGSTLSQIAILSEVTRKVVSDDLRAAGPLDRIARLCRESIDAMGDIVWAIDPHRDTPVHLSTRMRRFASDLLPPSDITLGFHVGDADNVRLGPDVRREVFLIFKETLHNIVRHAHATRVDVDLTLSPHRLQLIVQDDGCGVRPEAAGDGHGLRSMRRRAESVGGVLDVETHGQRGTCVTLVVSMRRHGAVAFLPKQVGHQAAPRR
jgi:signal transduction histidine kinase